MEEIVALCKRRGFVFPSSEIYGGLGSTYDYGHYGVLLKNNVKDEWWRAMLQERDDIVALDSAILQHPRVWEASGHLEGFTDPLVECLASASSAGARTTCARRSKPKAATPSAELRCPECGGELTEPRQFNLMFETHVGPVAARAPRSTCARRRRRASSSTSRTCSASPARSRRSGSPRSASPSATRSRPATSSSAPASSSRWRWSSSSRPPRPSSGTSTGSRSASAGTPTSASAPTTCASAPTTPTSSPTTRPATSDVEYLFPIGWSELEGIANRGDFDLTQHAKFSGEKLEYFDQQTKERYVPHVIEPAAGADRATLAFLVDAYEVEEVEGRQRTVLRLHPRLAPVKVAVLPLVSKEGMPEKAREIFEELRAPHPGRVRRGRLDRQALPPPGRDRHPLGHHRRPPDDGGRHRHPPRPRLPGADPGPDRGPRRRAGHAASNQPWRSPKLT